MILGDALAFALAAVALWAGARWLVESAATLAAGAGVSPLVIGLTVVAFGTSAPEFAVTIDAAFAGEADVSVGNVVGSNLFNVGIVLGGIALVHPFRVEESLVRRDAVAMGVATALALVFLANRSVGRLEGALLGIVLVAYLGGLVLDARRPSDENEGERGVGAIGRADVDPVSTVDRSVRSRLRSIGVLLVGLALVVAGGHVLVDTATNVAQAVGISAWVIGVTVVAGGTSVPELATSMAAVRRGDVAIAAGNVVGSNVFNLLGVLGIAAVIHPLAVDPDALIGFALLAGITAVVTVLLATGRRLTRLEGVVLVGLVCAYWGVSLGT